MPEKSKKSELPLVRFCNEWNSLDLYPKLYPAYMVPASFPQDVAKAQISPKPEGAIELPEDRHNAEAIKAWLDSLFAPDGNFFVLQVMLLAVSRRGQIGVLDVMMSSPLYEVGNDLNYVNVETSLRGPSRRKSWVDVRKVRAYSKTLKTGSGDGERQPGEQILRFSKQLKSMVREGIKHTESKVWGDRKRAEASKDLQEMIDEIKAQGIPLKEWADSGKADAAVEGSVGIISFATMGIECRVTTRSTRAERKAFVAMARSVLG